jgi:hypothetical protein
MATLPHSKIIVSRLRAAAHEYTTTRKRTAVHDFIALVYKLFWRIKRSPRSLIHQSNLRKRAKLPARIPLSSLLLNLASRDLDRRTLHRWKSLIEAAFEKEIRPELFKTGIISRGGVNRSLVHWREKSVATHPLPSSPALPLGQSGSQEPTADERYIEGKPGLNRQRMENLIPSSYMVRAELIWFSSSNCVSEMIGFSEALSKAAGNLSAEVVTKLSCKT